MSTGFSYIDWGSAADVTSPTPRNLTLLVVKNLLILAGNFVNSIYPSQPNSSAGVSI